MIVHLCQTFENFLLYSYILAVRPIFWERNKKEKHGKFVIKTLAMLVNFLPLLTWLFKLNMENGQSWPLIFCAVLKWLCLRIAIAFVMITQNMNMSRYSACLVTNQAPEHC